MIDPNEEGKSLAEVLRSLPLADYALSLPLHVLPHHLLSRIVLAATRVRSRRWKNFLIREVVRRFDVDLGEAAEPDPEAYGSFNEFFTRALAPGVRPLAAGDHAVISPNDGRVSEIGSLAGDRILQAKGRRYSVTGLLGGSDERAAPFRGGRFATLYLSPRDYHRLHMPYGGSLVETVYVPGRLFAVAPHSVRTVPRVFARNERLVALFDTAAGPMAMVLVGALFVGCIETVWSGVVTPPHRRSIRVTDHRDAPILLERGEEMGRFNMGSTVILLFGPGAVRWEPELRAGDPLRMGQLLGQSRVGLAPP